jgi:hypothetical protein
VIASLIENKNIVKKTPPSFFPFWETGMDKNQIS